MEIVSNSSQRCLLTPNSYEKWRESLMFWEMGIPPPALPSPSSQILRFGAWEYTGTATFPSLQSLKSLCPCQGLKEPRKYPKTAQTQDKPHKFPQEKVIPPWSLPIFLLHPIPWFFRNWGAFFEGAKLRDKGWDDPRKMGKMWPCPHPTFYG